MTALSGPHAPLTPRRAGSHARREAPISPAARAPVAPLPCPARSRRLVPKPRWLRAVEARLAARLGALVSPHALSLGKLVLVTPLLAAVLAAPSGLAWRAPAIVALLGAFAALDALDGLAARGRGPTALGRVLDRLTDYPLLALVAAHALDALPKPLLAARLAVDGALLLGYALGRGSTENRIRTVLSYATLFALVAVSEGWLPSLVTAKAASALLGASLAFSALVLARQVDLLSRRRIADLLSATNLAAGIASAAFAARGRPDLSLLCLLAGAACDGLDGAAARRFGGSRWGVLADDLADAVSYGVAPAVAIAVVVGGVEGFAIGGAFALFTAARLVFFTLNQAHADPRSFWGAPSTVGALIVLPAAILLGGHAAALGLATGIACALMVSFDARHRHVGRALAESPRARVALAAAAATVAAAGCALGASAAAALLLAGALAYALFPSGLHLARVARRGG